MFKCWETKTYPIFKIKQHIRKYVVKLVFKLKVFTPKCEDYNMLYWTNPTKYWKLSEKDFLKSSEFNQKVFEIVRNLYDPYNSYMIHSNFQPCVIIFGR